MKNDIDRDDNQARQDTSEDDNVRDAITWRDATTYEFNLPQVYGRFVEAGIARSLRTLRTLQRYCEQGHLRAKKYDTQTGSVWYVDPISVDTKIEEIRQIQETLQKAAPSIPDTSRSPVNEVSRHDDDRRSASPNEDNVSTDDMAATTTDEEARQRTDDAARRAGDDNGNGLGMSERRPTTGRDERYVTVPVGVLDALTAQLAAKDEQIKRRDDQMERLVEAHGEDRRMLAAALSIIHRDDFQLELDGGRKKEREPDPEPAQEIRPAPDQGGGNLQQSASDLGV